MGSPHQKGMARLQVSNERNGFRIWRMTAKLWSEWTIISPRATVLLLEFRLGLTDPYWKSNKHVKHVYRGFWRV